MATPPISVGLPSFSGTGSLSRFKDDFETFSALQGWEKEKQASLLPLCLSGIARDAYDSLGPKQKKDVSAAFEQLKAAFPADGVVEAQVQLRSLRFQPGGNLDAFVVQLRLLVSRAFPSTDSGGLLYNYFLQYRCQLRISKSWSVTAFKILMPPSKKSGTCHALLSYQRRPLDRSDRSPCQRQTRSDKKCRSSSQSSCVSNVLGSSPQVAEAKRLAVSARVSAVVSLATHGRPAANGTSRVTRVELWGIWLRYVTSRETPSGLGWAPIPDPNDRPQRPKGSSGDQIQVSGMSDHKSSDPASHSSRRNRVRFRRRQSRRKDGLLEPELDF